MSTENLKIRVGIDGEKQTQRGLDGTRRKVRGLGDETARTGRKFQAADRHGRQFGGGLRRLGGLMAAGAAAVGVYGLGRAVVTTGKSLARIEGIGRQTNAVIASTAGVANVSRRGLDDLAGALERKSGLEAESLTQGGNQLLTFTKIRNEVGKGNKVYDRALVSMSDYVASMKMAGREVAPAAAAIMYGKALNDPIKGMSALSRVGVQFTKEQKATITALQESGDTMGAQKVILKELETQYGGSARELGRSWGGQMSLIGHEIGTLQEAMGAKLMPKLVGATRQSRKFVQGMVDGTGAGGEFAGKLKTIGGYIATIASGFKMAWDKGVQFKRFLDGSGPAADAANIALGGLVGGLVAYKAITTGVAIATTGWAIAQGMLNVAMSLNPIVLVIAAVVGLGVALVVAYRKVGWFREAVDKAWKWIKRGARDLGKAFSMAWGGIKAGFGAMVDWIQGKWDKFARGLNAGLAAAGSLPGVPDNLQLPTFGGGGGSGGRSGGLGNIGNIGAGVATGATRPRGVAAGRSVERGAVGKRLGESFARASAASGPREIVVQVDRRELGRAMVGEAAWIGARA